MQNNKKSAELDLRGLVLVVVAVAWMAGILLASWHAPSPLLLLAGACAALVCLVVLWRNSRAQLFLLIILWLLLGAWRYAVASPIGDPQTISAFIGTNKLDVRGDVTDEPKLVGRTRLLVISANSISKDGGATWQDVHGQLDVQTLGGEIENPYGPNYGDSVELQGKIQGLCHLAHQVFSQAWSFRVSTSAVRAAILYWQHSITCVSNWQTSSHKHFPNPKQHC